MAEQATSSKGKIRQQIHHVIRTVQHGPIEPGSGAVPMDQVEAYLETYLNQGWTISPPVYLGSNNNGFTFMWFLSRKIRTA